MMNYQVLQNHRALPVYETSVLPAPYHRTEMAEYITLSCPEDGTVLEIHSEAAVTSAVVRPLSLQIRPELVDAHTLRVALPRPSSVSLEINGSPTGNLCIFASPVRGNLPSPDDQRVLYFADGEHNVDKLVLHEDDLTVFLSEGAHLVGKLELNDCHRVRICGRGRVECGKYTDTRHRVILDLVGCTDVEVEDICLLDSTFWCLRIFGCERVHIDHVHIIGYRGNTDGVDVVGSRHVLVENVFTRVRDDSLVVKGADATDRKNIHFNFPGTDSDFSAGFRMLGDVYDVRFRRCVLWNDFARPMEIGVSLRTDSVHDVTFEDIDVIRSTTGYPIMGIHHGDRALVRDLTFENIRIEDTPGAQLFDLRMASSVWSTDTKKGKIQNITFRNISLLGLPGLPVLPSQSRLEGADEESCIDGVRFEYISLLGRYAVSPETCNLKLCDHVKHVTFSAPEGAKTVSRIASSLTLEAPPTADARGI